MDALPSIAALVTMLAVYDAMKENIERRGATWMGKLNLDWPREPGEIYRDYDAALATLHDREYNRFYKALTRTFGPALADGLFDQYGEYLGIQEKHDAALVDEYLQTHEQTDGPPPNPAAVTHHLQGLLTKYLPKATEDLAYLKQGYDKQAEPTLPDGFDHPALNAWLESLHPIIENIQSQLVYMRQFIQRIPPAERSNRLSEACATIAPQCCLLHDELLLTLKQTSPRAQLETTGELTEKAYNEILGHMADYIVNNCVEQMLGDLIMQQDYGEVWPGCPSYLLSDETHRTAEAAVQRVLLAQGTRDKHLESPQLRDVSPEEYKGLLSPAPLKGTGHFPQG